MSDKKNSKENKTNEKPSIWDSEPVTECATKSAGKSKNLENKVIDN